MNLYLGGVLFFSLFYAVFVANLGWKDGSIAMAALLGGAAIISGAIGLLF